MPDIAITQRFESIVNSGEGDPNALARAAKQGDMQAAADLAALLARAGFVEPELILDVYDAAAAGWFGENHPPVDLTRGTGKASPALWQPFWDFIDDMVKTDPGTFTIPKGTLESTSESMPQDCDLTVTMERMATGTADPIFDSESWFKLHQVRTDTFTSKP